MNDAFEIHFKQDSKGREIHLEGIALNELNNLTQELLAIAHWASGDKQEVQIAVIPGSFGIRVLSVSLGMLMCQKILGAQHEPAPEEIRRILSRFGEGKAEVTLHGGSLNGELSLKGLKFATHKASLQKVSKILRGELIDAGGSSKTNFHLRTTDGQKLTIQAKREDLEALTENILYHQVVIKAKADYDPATRQCSNYELIEFLSLKQLPVELTQAQRAGAKVWADVTNGVDWVSEMRGDDE